MLSLLSLGYAPGSVPEHLLSLSVFQGTYLNTYPLSEHLLPELLAPCAVCTCSLVVPAPQAPDSWACSLSKDPENLLLKHASWACFLKTCYYYYLNNQWTCPPCVLAPEHVQYSICTLHHHVPALQLCKQLALTSSEHFCKECSLTRRIFCKGLCNFLRICWICIYWKFALRFKIKIFFQQI